MSTTADTPTVSLSTTLGEIARTMRASGSDAVVVIDASGEPVGVVTQRELVDAVAASRHPDQGTAESWMRTDVIAIEADGSSASGATRLPASDASILIESASSASSSSSSSSDAASSSSRSSRSRATS